MIPGGCAALCSWLPPAVPYPAMPTLPCPPCRALPCCAAGMCNLLSSCGVSAEDVLMPLLAASCDQSDQVSR